MKTARLNMIGPKKEEGEPGFGEDARRMTAREYLLQLESVGLSKEVQLGEEQDEDSEPEFDETGRRITPAALLLESLGRPIKVQPKSQRRVK